MQEESNTKAPPPPVCPQPRPVWSRLLPVGLGNVESQVRAPSPAPVFEF